jgi:hypothetical protein
MMPPARLPTRGGGLASSRRQISRICNRRVRSRLMEGYRSRLMEGHQEGGQPNILKICPKGNNKVCYDHISSSCYKFIYVQCYNCINRKYNTCVV